jgi:hypothetical protein
MTEIASHTLAKMSLQELAVLSSQVRDRARELIEKEQEELMTRLRKLFGMESLSSGHGNGNGHQHGNGQLLLTGPSPALKVKRQVRRPALDKRDLPPLLQNPANAKQRWSGKTVNVPLWVGRALRDGHTLSTMNIGGRFDHRFRNLARKALYDLELFEQGRERPLLSLRHHRHPPVAKYVNPKNPSEKWSGRGRPPKWARQMKARGQKLVQLHLTGPREKAGR